ncbi:MAG: fused MFS/spermidine synthase [Burkholderiales bacterium]
MLYASTIFISAFLLFQVQPVIAKMILPWFGGSSAVWTTCLLFFQLLLVAGYLYSYLLVHKLSSRSQALVHLALLIVAIALLPILPQDAWKPTGSEDPAGRILILLAATVGLQYFLLSTTTPLVQSWYSREKQGAMPYRLFALSNLGSMLALLTYPVAIEPFLPGRLQGWTWSAIFVVFAVLVAIIAWRGRALPPEPVDTSLTPAAAPAGSEYGVWIALPACASVLLLAITSHLSQNVAPMPFLWVLPLSLYLLTFILCFESSGWYRRWIYVPLMIAAFIGMGVTLTREYHNQPIWIMLPLYAGGLFLACMVCHGELAHAKPHPRHLTAYYLMMSVGGAIGGLFVSLAAPRFFNDLYELPVGIVGTVLVLAWVFTREEGVVSRVASRGSFALAALLAAGLAYAYKGLAEDTRVMVRNFYAALRVHDSGSDATAMRVLTHGTITHGKQYLDPEKRAWPTTYYGQKSGVGVAIETRRSISGAGIKIGVVGLGAGTLAAYGRDGDVVRIYEIDPQVVDLAKKEFTYLGDSKATIEIALGDARLSMEKESPQHFDVLAIDAFSSDSIPVHLLTREAFETYFKHMKAGGLLAVHISNRHLDLQPVVAEAVKALKKSARIADTDDEEALGTYGATWVLIGDSDDIFNHEKLKGAVEALEPKRSVGLWTDDFSDVYRILK